MYMTSIFFMNVCDFIVLCCQRAGVYMWKPKDIYALHLQWFLKEILILKIDTFLINRRSERRLLNSLVFTLSAVEKYWEKKSFSFIWQNVNSIFKVVFAKTPSIDFVIQEYWLKVLRASPNYAISFKQSKKTFLFSRLTPSLRRPCIHAIFFLRVRPEAVSTRHSWLWQTLDDVYTRRCFSES